MKCSKNMLLCYLIPDHMVLSLYVPVYIISYLSWNNSFLLVLPPLPVVWVFHWSRVHCYYLNHGHKLWYQILKVTATFTKLKQTSCNMLVRVYFFSKEQKLTAARPLLSQWKKACYLKQCFLNHLWWKTRCFFLFLFFKFYLFLAALGLCCCMQVFSSWGEQGLLCVVVHGLLIAVASLVAEHGL